MYGILIYFLRFVIIVLNDMKNSNYYILTIFISGAMALSHAQPKNYKIQNGIGLYGGITQFDIFTDNFEIKRGSGYIGGMSASADIPHRWYNVSYSIQLSENNIDITAVNSTTLSQEFVDYKMFTAQIAFLFHIKLISANLTFDIGPMLQYNGELELKTDTKKDYLILGYDNLRAEDLRDISNFNANGAVGLSLGLRRLLIRAQYIYGFTNILGSLNNKDFATQTNEKFKGNQSLLALTAMITL